MFKMSLDHRLVTIEDAGCIFDSPIIAITAEPIVAAHIGHHGRLLLNFKDVADNEVLQRFREEVQRVGRQARFDVTIDAKLVHEGPRDGGIYDPVLHVSKLYSFGLQSRTG